MPFLVKSSNGKRVVKMLTNHTPTENATSVAAAQVIDSLKGLSFKIEVKISDIVFDQQSQDISVPVELDFTQNGSTKDVNAACPTVKRVEVPRDNLPEDFNNVARPAVERGGKVEVPRENLPENFKLPSATTTPKFVPDHVFNNMIKKDQPSELVARESEIDPPYRAPRPVEHKPAPPALEKIPIAKLNVPEPPLKTEQPEVITKSPVEHQKVVEKQPPPRPAPVTEVVKKVAPKPTLIRGKLTVGATVLTCAIGSDEEANPPAYYIAYDSEEFIQVTRIISQMSKEIEHIPQTGSFEVGDIVFAKSLEDNEWYRASVRSITGDDINVFYFDWGLRENLGAMRLRKLTLPELGLAKHPACAIKTTFTEDSGDIVDEVVKGEQTFQMKVVSYDEKTECYDIKVLGQ